MFGNVTVEKAISFTQIITTVSCNWPPPTSATKFQVLRHKIHKFLAILSALIFLYPLIYGTHVHRNNKIIVAKLMCFIDAVCHVIFQIVVAAIASDRIQAIVQVMTDFCATAKSYERSILQLYVDKYSKFYGLSSCWLMIASGSFVVFTLFIAQPFPTDAEYPFAVDYEPLRTIMFLHQAYVIMQCCSMLCNNVFIALMLLFATARFEMLTMELRAVKNIETLIECVRKYYHLRSYAQEVVGVFGYTAIMTVIMATVPVVFCGINITGPLPLLVKVQFVLMAGAGFIEVFMCAWSADTLANMSEIAARSVYESAWYVQSVGMQKCVLLTLVPQKPLTISMVCFVPILSLKFFCSYVGNIFSLFTALRVVMYDDDEE